MNQELFVLFVALYIVALMHNMHAKSTKTLEQCKVSDAKFYSVSVAIPHTAYSTAVVQSKREQNSILESSYFQVGLSGIDPLPKSQYPKNMRYGSQ